MDFGFNPLQYKYPSRRSVMYGTKGMVCSSQPLAAQAGQDMIKKGGNAVDAAVAGNRQVIIGIHPVIKQVDCCPRRRNRRNRVVRNCRLGTKRQEETRRQRDGEGQNNRIWRDRAQPATTATRHDGPPLARPVFTRKFPA